MQKIFVDKSDTAADVFKYLKSTPEGLVMLVIPTESKLKTLASFRSLKKKSTELKKSLIIESVDEKILSLANSAKLEAIHPFLSNFKSNSMADIVLAPKAPKSKKAPARDKGKSAKVLKVKTGTEASVSVSLRRKTKPISVPVSRSWRRIWIPVAVFAVIFLAGLALNVFFTKADITVNFEKVPWTLQHTFVASTSVSGSGLGYAIPGQLLDQTKSIAQLFPATGKGQANQKATTQITIYNAYSADPQKLVATTRFQTPDGKIFRIDNDVLVPGATMQGGKLAPSTVTVPATADQAGDAYNTGPVPKLTIPGFAGSPKFNGFYGSIDQGVTGGFVGERAVATDQDVASAEQQATQIFQSVFQDTFLASPPEGLTIIDGASQMKILKLTVDKNVNADGNFAVLGQAEFRSIAFKEDDLKQRVQDLATPDYPDRVFQNFSMSYSGASPDFDHGTLSFTVNATGTLTTAFNPDEFKSEILGKSESDVHSLVLSIPHISDAKITLFPFWVKQIPQDKGRVNVNVQ